MKNPENSPENLKDPRFKNDLPEASSLEGYLKAYSSRLNEVINQVSAQNLNAVFDVLKTVIQEQGRIYIAGNGGSAAIADHLCCDWTKGTHTPGLAPLKTHSLSSNAALLTALANDFGYEQSFAKQIEMLAMPGDAALLISSSGNSPNIIEALETAKKMGLKTIGFCGFSGGQLKEKADHCLYVPANNYGIVEDAHQMLMHVLCQVLAKMRDAP
jgi:D-sedoheptulose 7-phosphate isomerase